MKRGLTAFLSTFILLLSGGLAGATPTQFGDTGMISQPTADTHQSGSICIGLWVNQASPETGGDQLLVPAALTLGLGSFLEAYGSYPNLAFNSDEGESDRGFANLGFKARILGKRSSPFKLAIDGQARRRVADDPTIDGLTDYLGRGIASFRFWKFGLHANGGYLETESPDVIDFENRTIYGGGLEFLPTPRLRFMAEYEKATELVKGLDDSEEATFGLQYHISPHLALTAAYSRGLTDFSPDWRIIFGLFTCQGTGTYIKPVKSGVIEPPAPQVEEPKPEPVKVLKIKTIGILPESTPTAADPTDPISRLEVPVQPGEEVVVIAPVADYRPVGPAGSSWAQRDAAPVGSLPPLEEAIPFTAVIASGTVAAIPPSTAPALAVSSAPLPGGKSPETTRLGGNTYEMGEYLIAQGKIVGQKVATEPGYRTHFNSFGKSGGDFVAEFYHDADRPLKVWVEGEVDHRLSAREVVPLEVVTLKVRLVGGEVPSFKLHVGADSEIFEFGPPGRWATEKPAAVEEAASVPIETGKTLVTTLQRKYRFPDFTFDLGRAELSGEGKRSLALVIDRVRKMNQDFVLRVDGHTDTTGSRNYNEKLSLNRAIAVATHLVVYEGIEPGRIFIKGFGESQPIAGNDTPEGRQVNRRSELLVLLPKEEKR